MAIKILVLGEAELAGAFCDPLYERHRLARGTPVEAIRALAPEIVLIRGEEALADSIKECRRLKAEDTLRGVPLIILTGPGVAAAGRVAGLKAGADDVLPAPESELLAARLHSLLRRKRNEDSLRYLARTDPLTGLPNRRALAAHLTLLLRKGTPVCVLAADLDRFKQVNDRYGHTGGDDVLKAAAQTLRRVLRKRDFVCRMGGEEFLAVLAGAEAAEAERVARRLHRAIAEARFAAWPGLRITISIGCAPARPGDSPRDVIARADRALYQAKQAGRNRIAAA